MSEAPTTLQTADIMEILELLPHRYPFLLVDKIIEIDGDNSCIGIKNVTFNEPQFTGHFPTRPIFPGVFLIEAMAQTASFSLYPYVHQQLDQFADGFQTILVGIDGVRFRRPVVPGDVLEIETVVTKARGKLWFFSCKITVDGQLAAEADLKANLQKSGLTT